MSFTGRGGSSPPSDTNNTWSASSLGSSPTRPPHSFLRHSRSGTLPPTLRDYRSSVARVPTHATPPRPQRLPGSAEFVPRTGENATVRSRFPGPFRNPLVHTVGQTTLAERDSRGCQGPPWRQGTGSSSACCVDRRSASISDQRLVRQTLEALWAQAISTKPPPPCIRCHRKPLALDLCHGRGVIHRCRIAAFDNVRTRYRWPVTPPDSTSDRPAFGFSRFDGRLSTLSRTRKPTASAQPCTQPASATST